MSGFAVQPPALRQLADLLERAASDAGGVRLHLEPINTLAATDGAFDAATHASVISGIRDWFYDLGMVCAESGTAVRNAATYYETTDREQARTYDETEFPDDVYVTDTREATGYVPIEPPEGTASFDDVLEPADHLHPAIDKTAYDEEDMSHISWYESFSISALMNETFVQASEVLSFLGLIDRPYNPLEELFRPWVGDWAGVRATGDALYNSGHASRQIGVNLRWASQGCEKVWEGNAGDGATVYIMLAAERPDELCVPLLDLSDAYKQVAEDMVEHRNALTSLYKTIIDLCIEIAAAGAVAGGATATGVGAPVGGLAALYLAYKATRFAQTVNAMFDAINYFYTALTTLQGAWGSFDTHSGSIALPPMPASDIPAPG